MPLNDVVAGTPLTQYASRFKDKSTPCVVTIDGHAVKAYKGEPLLDAMARVGMEIAHVCYHHQMGPIETCDTCMVEAGFNGAATNGETRGGETKGLRRACALECADGLVVVTESMRAKAAQLEGFDRLLGNHLLYCTVCDNNNGNCTVHNTTALLEVEHQKIPYKPKPYEQDHSNPFYRYDPDQCILCGRCVEACQNVQVNETLSIRWEDEHPRVLWDGGKPIGESSCVSCGHCISVCPCNALMEKSMLGEAGYFTYLAPKTLEAMIEVVKGIEPEVGYGAILGLSQAEAAMRDTRTKKTKTVCTYCGVGCSFEIWTRGRHILKVEPYAGATNGVSTCVKGKFGWDYTNHADRLQKPLVRDGNVFRETTWDDAITLIAAKFSEIKREHGPDALAFVASSKTTNEEAYLMQKLARAVVGTNNIDNCSRYCQSPATKGLWRTVGYGGDSGSISDIERADLVVVVGSNTCESHPVLATRVKQAHKLRGQKLIVADRRKHEMAERADVYMQTNPGSDLAWLCAVTKYIIDQGWEKRAFIDKWVNGFDDYKAKLSSFTLEFAEEKSGIPVATLKQIAEMITKAERVCFLWAMGITQHCDGSDASTAISNLLLVTGNYMREGTGAYPLRGHNNVQGASDFGAMPDRYPGYEMVSDPIAHKRMEDGWGVKLPSGKGLDNHEMVEALEKRTLRSLYIKGEDMITADSHQERVAAAFEMADFMVVQDCFFSETCRYADVVLPASPALEKEGTFTSTERRIQRLYQAMDPLGDSKPDWEIIQLVANALGAEWKYTHPSQIMEEAARLTPMFAGVTYERLEGWNTLQWPVAIDGTDQPLLYTERFHFDDGKAILYPVQWTEPTDPVTREYNYSLNNGRLLEHFHEGNMTYRVKGIKEITPDSFLELSPELAKKLDVSDGRWLEVKSERGFVKVRALVTDRVSGDEVFLSLNSSTEPVNRLTSSETDPAVHTPAYKECAVQINVLPYKGEPVLGKNNFRYGTRTPQDGVEVERKWKRKDYSEPGGDRLVQIETLRDMLSPIQVGGKAEQDGR
jgi:formate dehydrogenase major subunit